MDTANDQNHGVSTPIIQHYHDLNDRFYQLWLDPTSTYSAALWQEHDTLEQAQLRKIDFHITQARAGGRERILEVGCGWGSTLKRLVEQHGVRHAVGLTLSNAQAEWIASLQKPSIEVRLESWLEHNPAQSYDGIISIGAFEHFAHQDLSQDEKIEVYRHFFQRCHHWLKPGGRLSLQTVAYGHRPTRYGDAYRFIVNEVFPESWYPWLSEILLASQPWFELVALRNDRQDYEQTCRAWLNELKTNRTTAIGLVGKDIVQRYEKFLSISMIGFHLGATHLLRLTLARIDDPMPMNQPGA